MRSIRLISKLRIIFLFAILTSALACSSRANELAVGAAAKRKGPATVDVVGPQNFNYLSRAAVLKLREGRVGAYRTLLAGAYEPDPFIFDRIEDGKPWWGTVGASVFGKGGHSIDGPARESGYILNPFRLVCAEPTLGGIWNLRALKAADLRDPDFPADWRAGPVTYDAANRIAQVTYYVSEFQKKLDGPWASKLAFPFKSRSFSMVAYNARDFGYSYMYLSPNESVNIKQWQGPEPVLIAQMLHCGGSCGYPGGCNNMSPSIQKLDYNSIQALPARAYIKLWQEEPQRRSAPPDMVFVINFI